MPSILKCKKELGDTAKKLSDEVEGKNFPDNND